MSSAKSCQAGANYCLANTKPPIHSGKDSIYFRPDKGSYIAVGPPAPSQLTPYTHLDIWINGGSAGGQILNVGFYPQVSGFACDGVLLNNYLSGGTIEANEWKLAHIPLREMGADGVVVTALAVVEPTGYGSHPRNQPAVYLDDIRLVTDTGAGLSISGPALAVDATAGQHPISPYIYGVNFAGSNGFNNPFDPTLAKSLGVTVNRWGGNATTRYNWDLNFNGMLGGTNLASDFFFENSCCVSRIGLDLSKESESDYFVDKNRNDHVKSLITVPAIGWTAKNNSNYTCGFSQKKYHYIAQSFDTDTPNNTDCGNGVNASNGSFVTGNDPHDTSTAVTPGFEQQWVQHLVGQYGTAAKGGVLFYGLDNEPMIWDSTHRDVHPAHSHDTEIVNVAASHAAVIKAADPTAMVIGPTEDSPTRYRFSEYDVVQQSVNGTTPDFAAHGYYLQYYLKQMQAYQNQHHERILDYLDEHYYPSPQGANLAFGCAGTISNQRLRFYATRSFWDPGYIDNTFLDGFGVFPIIPTFKTEIANDYPGTRTSISEYNLGGVEHISGAIAQADLLGIFGRYGLDLATMWAPPLSSQPAAFSFRMFRNYNGAGGTFGNTSVTATSGNSNELAIYAALQGSSGPLTVMVLNKDPKHDLQSILGLSHFTPSGPVLVYRYSNAAPNAIVHEPNIAAALTMDLLFPSYSITLLVFPGKP
jgi:hypothetical protein